MSTLQLQAPHIAQVRFSPVIARIMSDIALFLDAFAEAQQMARADGKRYTFAQS